MSVGLWRGIVTGVAVLTGAGWADVLYASPLANQTVPLAGDAADPRLDFVARAVLPGDMPGWSLGRDLRGFNAAPAALMVPPANVPDQTASTGTPVASADPRQGADTLPEPASILVFAVGVAGLYSLRRPIGTRATSRFSSRQASGDGPAAPSP